MDCYRTEFLTVVFGVAFDLAPDTLTGLEMNSEFCKQALAKVGNPNILVNVVSRRVRQLTTGGGANSRPLIADTAGLGAGDIALLEIIEDKMSWAMVKDEQGDELPVRKKRKKA